MIADVCDQDELKTGERREGMYGAIFWWVVKLGNGRCHRAPADTSWSTPASTSTSVEDSPNARSS